MISYDVCLSDVFHLVRKSLGPSMLLQMINKVLLYNTGDYSQYPMRNYNGKEYENIYVCVYIYIYIQCVCIYN